MIAILDFGGQYAHLIATRLRSFGVFTEIFDSTVSIEHLKEKTVKGIVLSGGPQSVFDPASPQIDKRIYKLGVPILSICYGHQLTSQTLGGKVVPGTKPEYGPADIQVIKKSSKLLQGVSPVSRVWMSHNDEVEAIPEGFEIIASTDSCEVAAAEWAEKNFYGVQFHPEVVHSKQGGIMLGNFVDICGQRDSWELGDFISEQCEKIKKQVGSKRVFLFVSGGVDSTVAFALLEKALGKEKVFGVFVDTGLLRHSERKMVEESIAAAGFENLHTEDASELFLSQLKEVYEPEAKRKIIGDAFLAVQRKVVKDLNLNPDEWLLGQGTIYPDTIESGGTKNSDKIKTHHNRVPEIQKMIEEGKIIEPLADLYKDEVREVGRKLGLPGDMVDRHPFPGPGLGVRILCSTESGEIGDRRQESGVRGELGVRRKEKGVRKNIDSLSPSCLLAPSSYLLEKAPSSCLLKGSLPLDFQILPVKSVGVQGDGRTYRHPAAVYLGEKAIDWDELDTLSVKITNSSKLVNRVVLCLSHTVPQTFSLEKAYITASRVEKLQKADAIAQRMLHEWETAQLSLHRSEQNPPSPPYQGGTDTPLLKVWQFPVVLLPLITANGGEAIVLRPIYSNEAMTAEFARLPQSLLEKMTKEILEIDGLSAVFYDLTHKPPGTIEWE